MKRKLLLSCGMLAAAATLQAAAPEGNLYIIGLNGDNAPSEANCLVLGERSEDDIDEGVWRWSLPEVELTAGEGSFTVSDGASLTLGFDADNLFGFTNNLTATQNMIYHTPDGPAVNYSLSDGQYQVFVALFEDLDGDMGGDSWMVQMKALGGEETEESIYLLGFNGTSEPSAACRFQREVTEEAGETIVTNTLKRYYISSTEGFTVYDGVADASLGADLAFGGAPVSDESPMAFLSAGGDPVACTLTEGYYDVNFVSMGAMSMVTFLHCEDQTPQDALDYYLVGLNGTTALDEAYKFTRTVETGSFEDEDTGETVEYSSISYTLAGVEVKEPGSVTVEAQDGFYSFGYNTDMAAFFPNDFSNDLPFASLVAGGYALSCSLEAGKYDFTFAISSVNMGVLSALPAEEGAVDGISGVTGEAVYFNLQGVRVQNPENGIFIKLTDGKVTKVVR